jgi:predicted ATPase
MRAHHTQITLNRLSVSNVRSMVGQVAAQKSLSDETIATVVERTGGVPLFVEELTRAVIESGNPKLTEREIPTTLHDSLMARLDRLGSAKEVAQIAAVIGREFSYDLLHAVHPIAAADLQQALSRLTDAELLYVRGIAPEATYQFKHALIQDAAYEALLKSRRKELHLIVARTIDEKFPVIKETHPEALARHWTDAGEIDIAIQYFQLAGERAVARGAMVEAERHYRAALQLLSQLPEDVQRDRRELALQLAYGPTAITVKGWAAPETEGAYTRARELCGRSGDDRAVTDALFGLWVNHLVRSDFRIAYEIGEQLLQRAQSVNDPTLLMFAHQTLGDTSYSLGKFPLALEHLERAISLCSSERQRALGVDMEVVARSYAAGTLWLLGYPEKALKRVEGAVALARELADPFSQAFAGNFASSIQLRRREAPAAQATAERVIALCVEHGFAYWLAHLTVACGGAVTAQGRGDEGIALIEQGMSAVAATGGNPTHEDFLPLLATAYADVGRLGDALDALTRSLAAVEKYDERVFEAETHRLKGKMLLWIGDANFAEARHCFERAIEIARKQSAKSWELRATTSLARLLDKQGRRDEARAMLAAIYNWFTEGFDTADLKDAKALLEELGA